MEGVEGYQGRNAEPSESALAPLLTQGLLGQNIKEKNYPALVVTMEIEPSYAKAP